MLKKTWDYIKPIVTLKSKNKTARNSIIVNENDIKYKNYIAEILNGFLLMFVQILRLKYRKQKGLLINTYSRKIIVNLFSINPVQGSDSKKLINNLNQNKSSCPCSIPVKMLQNHVDFLKQPLTYLINLSFQRGVFQELLLPLKPNIFSFLLIIIPSMLLAKWF